MLNQYTKAGCACIHRQNNSGARRPTFSRTGETPQGQRGGEMLQTIWGLRRQQHHQNADSELFYACQQGDRYGHQRGWRGSSAKGPAVACWRLSMLHWSQPSTSILRKNLKRNLQGNLSNNLAKKLTKNLSKFSRYYIQHRWESWCPLSSRAGFIKRL